MNFLKISLFVLLITPVHSYANDLTFKNVYLKALEYDATLNAARLEFKSDGFEIDKAFSAFLPQARIAASKGRGYTESESPTASNQTLTRNSSYETQNYSFTVKQAIYNKLAFAEYNQAILTVEKSEKKLKKESATLLNRVVAAYLDNLLSEELIFHNNLLKTTVETQLLLSQKKYSVGLGTVTEVNEAKASLESISAKAIELSGQLETSKQDIYNLTGEYPSELSKLNHQKLSMFVNSIENLDYWLSKVMTENYDIALLKYDVKLLTEDIQKKSAGHFPTLDLVASKSDSTSENNFTIGSRFKSEVISLQLNIPIYSGGYVDASVNQSIAKLKMSNYKLIERERIVKSEVIKLYNSIKTGNARIKALEQLVSSNESMVYGTKKGYEAGIRSNVEVLNAQDKLHTSQKDLSKEKYQIIYNYGLLKYNSGLLSEDDVETFNGLLSVK